MLYIYLYFKILLSLLSQSREKIYISFVMRIMYTNASIIGLSPSSLHVLERSFYMGYKWILANLSMTRGKI